MKVKVILYDTKYELDEKVKILRSNNNLLCIGVEDVAKNISKKKRTSFKESKWIEITDSRSCRRVGKKFPVLNLPLFTKTNPDGETQGQTLLGKFSTHEFRCTDISYEDFEEATRASRLRDDILRFFKHYRSKEARKKYEILNCVDFESEFSQFEKYIKQYWSLEI